MLHLEKSDLMSKVTKKVIDDFNRMTNQQFMNKYCCTKARYYKRVMKYGDPYMKSPLARIGKFLKKLF